MSIRAQLTLPDGRTPGATRKGATVILACIANGCRIVRNPLNKIPDEWSKWYVDNDDNVGQDRGGRGDSIAMGGNAAGREVVSSGMDSTNTGTGVQPQAQEKKKRGRPKKVA